MAVKISRILSVRERQGSASNPEVLLKGQHTQSGSQTLTLGFGGGRGGWSRQELCEGRLGCVAPGRELKGQLPESLC